MPTQITRGQMFSVTFAVPDELYSAMGASHEVALAATKTGAIYWHTKILPRHFYGDASSRYGYAPRSKSYRKQKDWRSQPDLVNTGAMRDQLKGRLALVEGKSTIDARMFARALNLAPAMPKNSQDLYVPTRKRTYPNMKREIRAFTEDERDAVAAVVTEDARRRFQPR